MHKLKVALGQMLGGGRLLLFFWDKGFEPLSFFSGNKLQFRFEPASNLKTLFLSVLCPLCWGGRGALIRLQHPF